LLSSTPADQAGLELLQVFYVPMFMGWAPLTWIQVHPVGERKAGAFGPRAARDAPTSASFHPTRAVECGAVASCCRDA